MFEWVIVCFDLVFDWKLFWLIVELLGFEWMVFFIFRVGEEGFDLIDWFFVVVLCLFFFVCIFLLMKFF